jgi:nitrogen regulatory protein PII
MKAVFVIFNQAHTERVEFILDQLEIRGYTWWSEVKGRGTNSGEPRMGSHTWPEMNSALITMVEDEQVAQLIEKIKKIDQVNTEVGIRAFVWDAVQGF